MIGPLGDSNGQPALFRHLPRQSKTIGWSKLIEKPTPVQPLAALSRRYGRELYAKREDATDTVYGGNKVRNLEFILGEALARGQSEVITVAPVGSNFIAALVAQARKLSIKVHVRHFIPSLTPQMEAHWFFSKGQGMSATYFQGRAGAIPAWLSAQTARLQPVQRPYWIAPGGSSVQGALGHVSAALELAEQIEAGILPVPEVLLVGAGTCGTMAGLTAGLLLSGLRTQLVGIRCVDPIVCNRPAIARLANQVLARLGSSERVRASQIRLVDAPGRQGYGMPVADAAELSAEFLGEENLQLDTTYTTKVVAALKHGLVPAGRTLYWHTFSPKAMEYLVPAPVPRPYSAFRYWARISRPASSLYAAKSCEVIGP